MGQEGLGIPNRAGLGGTGLNLLGRLECLGLDRVDQARAGLVRAR